MKEIAEKVFIETGTAGVTLGAVVEPSLVTYIDAPLLQENIRLWRNGVTGKKKLLPRLILLDAHHDRCIGSRFLEATIITQEDTYSVYQNRPITFKPISMNSGSEWEKIKNMPGFRWAYPEMIFSEIMDIHSEQITISLRHVPGPSIGSSWVIVPERKVLFIGDTIVKNQVPFLADANIPLWLTALDRLSDYSGFSIVCGRGGLVEKKDIEAMRGFLLNTQKLIDELPQTDDPAAHLSSMIPQLKFEKYFSVPKSEISTALERLTYGLSRGFFGVQHSAAE